MVVLSRLIPEFKTYFEDTVTAAMKFEASIKNILCNTIRELPVRLSEIKEKAKYVEYIESIKIYLRIKKIKSCKVVQIRTFFNVHRP